MQAGIPYSSIKIADEGAVWRWYEILCWTHRVDEEEQQRMMERYRQNYGG